MSEGIITGTSIRSIGGLTSIAGAAGNTIRLGGSRLLGETAGATNFLGLARIPTGEAVFVLVKLVTRLPVHLMVVSTVSPGSRSGGEITKTDGNR